MCWLKLFGVGTLEITDGEMPWALGETKMAGSLFLNPPTTVEFIGLGKKTDRLFQTCNKSLQLKKNLPVV